MDYVFPVQLGPCPGDPAWNLGEAGGQQALGSPRILVVSSSLRIENSRQGRFGGVAVTFSLCYCTKGTIFMPYIAKYLIKFPIN